MREKISRFIKSNGSSKKVLPIFLLVLFLGLFVFIKPAQAGISAWIWNAVAAIAEAIASLMGGWLLQIINFLIVVSGYNNFINADVVNIGWKLVRDVANMFYILLMLVMAFGTMLRLEQYSWKKMMPRLIGTAILVNFSKTIIGLLIDFGQVIMLTFVNAYAATAGGNFVQMFGIKDILELTKKGTTNDDADAQAMKNALGFILGAIILTVTTLVTGIFAFLLLFRIITIWILIVFSPLAFLLGIFPKGQEYYKDWWKELINNIILGPLVAFFLWLTLATMGQGGQMAQMRVNNAIKENQAPSTSTEKDVFAGNIAGTAISEWENMGSLFVALAMLFVALDKIGKLGVLGGGMATGASSWMKNTAKTGLKKYAIPAALTAYTGGGILTAMGMRAGLKAGIGTAQGLPLVGGAFKALAKEGDKYGLASEKGLGGYAGRKGAGLISQGKEAVLTRISRTGIGGVLVGTAARGAAATMKSERLKTARDAEKHVSEYKDEDVIKAAKGKGLTSEGQSEKLAAIGRILGESKLKKQVSDGDLQEMIGALPKLGEDLGKGKEVDGLLKGFYKENPELRMSTPATGTKPAKSRGEYIEEDLRGMSPDAATKMSVKSLKDEEVVEHMSKEQIKKVFSDGDEERQLALAGTILKKETGGTLDHDKLDNPSNPANQADINTALQGLMTSGRIGALPKGIFDAMPLVFAQLNADLQKTLLDEKLFSNPSKEHFVDGSGDPTDKGKKLAMEVAESGKDDLIKELQIKVGAEFGKALKEAVGDLTASGGRPDPRVANILASLQTTSTAMLTEARKASGTGGLGASVKGQDAYKWIKKLKHSDLVNSSGTATPEGLEIVQNISVSNLSRVIQEAGASGSPQMKEMAGSLTALVEKAMVVAAPGVTPPPGSVVVSDKVRKGLDDLLKEPSTVGAIDWLSKGGLNLR